MTPLQAGEQEPAMSTAVRSKRPGRGAYWLKAYSAPVDLIHEVRGKCVDRNEFIRGKHYPDKDGTCVFCSRTNLKVKGEADENQKRCEKSQEESS